MLFTMISLRDKQGRQVFHITVETCEQGETCGKEYQYRNWFLFFLIFFLMQAGVLEGTGWSSICPAEEGYPTS